MLIRDMKSSSTIFLYTDMHKFYSQLKPMMNPATWNEIQSNKDVLLFIPLLDDAGDRR